MSLRLVQLGTKESFIAWRTGREWSSWHIPHGDKCYCGRAPEGSVCYLPSVPVDLVCANCLLAMQRELGRGILREVA